MILKKDFLGIYGEYLVNAELISRNIFAQVTFGNMKKMDILVNYQDKKDNEFFKIIEVKTKQDGNFFWFHGIPLKDKNHLVVFVDLKDKTFDDKPDFYILDVNDVLENTIEQVKRYANNIRSSTKKLTNVNSKFINEHPDYELKINKKGDQIEFNLEKDHDIYKFAYLDLKTGSIFQIGKKIKYVTMGWDFYTFLMTKYKDQWHKIPMTPK